MQLSLPRQRTSERELVKSQPRLQVKVPLPGPESETQAGVLDRRTGPYLDETGPCQMSYACCSVSGRVEGKDKQNNSSRCSVSGKRSINTCTEQVMLAELIRCTPAHNELSVKSH
jgi:hypothetical protein